MLYSQQPGQVLHRGSCKHHRAYNLLTPKVTYRVEKQQFAALQAVKGHDHR